MYHFNLKTEIVIKSPISYIYFPVMKFIDCFRLWTQNFGYQETISCHVTTSKHLN